MSYTAFDFVTRNQDLYVALVSRSGLLSLLEPSEPTTLSSWREIDALYPFGQHHRGSEPRLDLSFQHALGACSQALEAGLDPTAISLAVSSANSVKIYRALKSEGDVYQFHEVLELPIDFTLVNAIAWAPGGVNATDIIAIACDDSNVRIVEVTVENSSAGSLSTSIKSPHVAARRDSDNARSIASGISAELAGMNRTTAPRKDVSRASLEHAAKEVAVLQLHNDVPVYGLKWNVDGTWILGNYSWARADSI